MGSINLSRVIDLLRGADARELQESFRQFFPRPAVAAMDRWLSRKGCGSCRGALLEELSADADRVQAWLRRNDLLDRIVIATQQARVREDAWGLPDRGTLRGLRIRLIDRQADWSEFWALIDARGLTFSGLHVERDPRSGQPPPDANPKELLEFSRLSDEQVSTMGEEWLVARHGALTVYFW